ncbi:MAG TPA: glycosyl hydrolase, partial [Anseongella sp.]|nr:glycosyl hydrolase [Anseongella sp.]
QELFRFAVKEAERLGLVLSASIQSGWNLGGPDVKPQESAKHLTWSETVIEGAGPVRQELPRPRARLDFYRDIAVLAFRRDDTSAIPPVENLRHKAAFDEAAFSASDTRHLLGEAGPEKPGTAFAGPGRAYAGAGGPAHTTATEVLDLSDHMDRSGMLNWQSPGGRWVILRFGYTNNGSHVSTASGDWQGLVLDYMSEAHFTRYWDTWVRPMLESIGPLAGSTLKYLQTDSWELGGINWTENFREEFRKRRGYDLFPYLPVIAGKIVGSREISHRFLADFRKTISDCISDNHYRVFAEKAAEFGMGIQPESAGPHAGPFDGLKNYGHSDIMMSEFWSPSDHRPTPALRFFVKQAASAAHIYNKRLVGAEGFTTIGKHWNDVIWADMKPSFDYSVCGGLNLAFLHTFTSSPPEMGIPGQEYFAGTHFNPNITWWKYSDAFFDYMARCQYMMQQGSFVADVLYYYGDHIPNIALRKDSDPAG